MPIIPLSALTQGRRERGPTTLNVDLLVNLQAEHLSALAAALAAEYFVDVASTYEPGAARAQLLTRTPQHIYLLPCAAPRLRAPIQPAVQAVVLRQPPSKNGCVTD